MALIATEQSSSLSQESQAPNPTPASPSGKQVYQDEGQIDTSATQTEPLLPSSAADNNPNDPTPDQKILTLLRQSILPFSDRLDPFAALPVHLDRLQEHLVSFYLLHYPKVTYGFSPRLRPHPVATNFSIALTTPACFQVILARSALYRLSLSKYVGDNQKKALEVVMMRHKGEALRLIRLLSAKSSPTRKDDLIASIISLGTLDRRTGSNDAAGMHFMAVRRILRATGGPLAVKSLLLSRVMVFFECIYGTSPQSYIWDESDLKHLLPELNTFFGRIWTLWKHKSAVARYRNRDGPLSEGSIQPYLERGTDLHAIISRDSGPAEPSEATPVLPQHRLEMISQLTSLLTLAAVILDYENLPPSARLSTFMAPEHPGSPSISTNPTSSRPSAPAHQRRASTASATSTRQSTRRRSATTYTSLPTSSATSSAGFQAQLPIAIPASLSNLPALAPAPLPKKPASISSPLPDSHPSATQSQPPTALQTYISSLTTSISALDLKSQPSNNVMWSIQMHDHSTPHNVRVWRAASFAWVLKHVSWNVQGDVRRWLVRWMEGGSVFGSTDGTGESLVVDDGPRPEPGNIAGETPDRPKKHARFAPGEGMKESRMKLNAFHFSYAA